MLEVIIFILAESISISTNIIYGGIAMVFRPKHQHTSTWNSTIPRYNELDKFLVNLGKTFKNGKN
mgnify:CR=1 FL=1